MGGGDWWRIEIEQRGWAAMFYNYHEIFIILLLLPVVLNIVLPLMMLVLWPLKQVLVPKRRSSLEGEFVDQE